MKSSALQSEDTGSRLDAPPRPELRWVRWLLILFLFSFALDIRPAGAGEGFAGGDFLSLSLLGLALASGGLAALIGLRHLLVRPGAFLILLAFAGIGLALLAGIVRGNSLSEIAVSLVTPLLIGLGVVTTHVAACAGMRATEAIRWFVIAAGASLAWNLGIGFVARQTDVFEASLGLVGPAAGFLAAWMACLVLLRRTVTRKTLVHCFVTIALAASVVFFRAGFLILFPAAAATVCLVLGLKWRLFPREQWWKRAIPAGALVILGLAQLFLDGFGRNLFSSGLLQPDHRTGTLALLALGLLGMGLSLRSARRNAETVMGRWAQDAHLMFFPFIALLTFVGECVVHPPLSHPFAAVLFGLVAALPQFYFNRACYLRHRENEAAITPQLILSEEDVPTTWEGVFPSKA